jgi:hypothetical protein
VTSETIDAICLPDGARLADVRAYNTELYLAGHSPDVDRQGSAFGVWIYGDNAIKTLRLQPQDDPEIEEKRRLFSTLRLLKECYFGRELARNINVPAMYGVHFRDQYPFLVMETLDLTNIRDIPSRVMRRLAKWSVKAQLRKARRLGFTPGDYSYNKPLGRANNCLHSDGRVHLFDFENWELPGFYEMLQELMPDFPVERASKIKKEELLLD